MIQLINKKRDPREEARPRRGLRASRSCLRRAQRGAARGARVAGRHRARERDPLRGDPATSSRASCTPAWRRSSSATRRRAATRGASRELTVGLAERGRPRRHRPVPRAQLHRATICSELEYASLLHDFGKIGVREQVLVKAKKLYPHELELDPRALRLSRCKLPRSSCSRAKLRADRARRAATSDLRALDRAARAAPRRAARRLATRSSAPNEPTVLERGRLLAHRGDRARCTYRRLERRGACRSTTTRRSRSRSRAARSARARSTRSAVHVVHTYNFLSQIPWGKTLRAHPRHRARAPREAQRHWLSELGCARGDPAAVQDHEHHRHLRRAHRERSPVQEGGAASARSTSSASR